MHSLGRSRVLQVMESALLSLDGAQPEPRAKANDTQVRAGEQVFSPLSNGYDAAVAPHAGARIETSRDNARSPARDTCRPPRGGAD